MNEPTPDPETRIAIFQHKTIRRTIHNNEWWFVITDVVGALTDSVDPSDYRKKMRKRDPELAAVLQGGQFVPPLGIEFDTAGDLAASLLASHSNHLVQFLKREQPRHPAAPA